MTWWLLLIHHFRDGKSENEMFCNLRKVTQFINARKWKVIVIFAQLCPTLCNPWTIACLTPLSMEFSRQEYWSGLPCSSPRDLLDPGIKLASPALAGSFTNRLLCSRLCLAFGINLDAKRAFIFLHKYFDLLLLFSSSFTASLNLWWWCLWFP